MRRVGRRLCRRERAARLHGQRVVHVHHDAATIRGHGERAPHHAIAEQGMRTTGLLVNEIESEVAVFQCGREHEMQLRVAGHFRHLVGSHRFEEVGLTGDYACERGHRVRSDGEHHAIELRAAPASGGVGHEFQQLLRNPACHAEGTAANRHHRDGCGGEPAAIRRAQQVLRQHVELVDDLEELVGPALLEPDDGRERIARADGIHVRKQQRRG